MILIAMLLASGCGGDERGEETRAPIDPSSVADEIPTSPVSTSTSSAPTSETTDFVRAGWLRLSRSQLERSLDQLLSTSDSSSRVADYATAPELLPTHYSGDEPRSGSRLVIDGYLLNLSDAEIAEAVSCEGDCTAALQHFAQLAWRRPVTPDEVEGLATLSLRDAISSVLAAAEFYLLPLLGSPSETGAGEGLVVLGGFEIASLMSYALTFLPPDHLLLADAASGALLDGSTRSAHVERLWGSTESITSTQALIRHWLGVESRGASSELVPLEAQLEETNRLIEHVAFTLDAPISELLTADYSFVNGTLGDFYGLTVQGGDWQPVDLSDSPRRGILNHASWLRSFSGAIPSYSKRGLTPGRLLCEPLPEPPDTIDALPPIPSAQDTSRESMEASTASEACQPCHQVLDPLAFSFENFDGFGSYREVDNGQPVDATGSVVTFNGHFFEFQDSRDLLAQITARPEFDACFLQHLSATWFGLASDEPAIAAFAAEGDAARSLRTAVIKLVASDFFITRSGQ